MALVSISKAAKLAGCTRSNLYKTYIHTGKLSVTNDHQGKPKIDTSELLRVFGSLQGDSEAGDGVGQKSTPGIQQVDSTGKDELIALLKEQLAEAKEEAAEREQWYRQQIGELTTTIKQLEHKPTEPFWKNWFK